MPQQKISTSASGATQLVAAPGAGLFIRVFGFSLSANGTVNAKFQSASTDMTGLYYLTQFGGVVRQNEQCLFDCAANEALNINLSGAVAVGGEITYAIIGVR